MKTIYSFLLAAAALFVVSCGGNANKPATETEEVIEIVIPADTTANAELDECCEGKKAEVEEEA